jgi:hypothetical protein
VGIDEEEARQESFQLPVLGMWDFCCEGEKMVKPMLVNIRLERVQTSSNVDYFLRGRDAGIGKVEAKSEVVQTSDGSTALRIP